ncbi:MAG: PD40 domain-containing protein [Bacteroidales bacterium]|nr:PD40 domain-containing protein [Bacteroidales bacterium]
MNGSPAPKMADEDSVRVKELLVMDTVDLKIHGPGNDVTFYMNGMVFLSNTKYHQNMIPDHITFGVIKAYFVPLEYIALESSRPLFINDDFPYSPAGMSFTRDYRTVYFTKKVGLSGRRNVEKIFEMSIINGEGSRHNQLSFTGDPSRYMHPAVSLDDSYMIFSSDRTPSNGGLDLFISSKTEAGWSTPVNMGSSINTSGHEWYPYLDHNNNLYFSSSGHMGIGGYDVYVCFFNGSSWGEPQNLTDYINTSNDELGFSIHPNKKMAVFSTSLEPESTPGEIYKMSLDNKAFLLSGIEDTRNQDISLLLRDLVETGFTSAVFAAGTETLEDIGFDMSAMPLLAETDVTGTAGPEAAEQQQEQEPEPEPATVVPVVVPLVQESEPEPELQVAEPEPVLTVAATEPEVEEPESEPELEPDPDQVVFRVQILSASKANSNQSVTIAGTRYSTYEYYYKGAYRITVGEFTSVQEALSFRTKCKNAGYSQGFVAAFRNNERETDPSVFKR